MKYRFLLAFNQFLILLLLSKPTFPESTATVPKRFHVLFTGVPLFAPFANAGLDIGFDFWHINDNFRLNAKISGQYALEIFATSDEIASAGQSWGGDFSLNAALRLPVTRGTFIFTLGPSVGGFQEQVKIRYKSQTTKETVSLLASDYRRVLAGYNFGFYLETATAPGFVFGLSWTGLFNDTLQLPYAVSGGPTGNYEHRFIGANLLEFVTGVKF